MRTGDNRIDFPDESVDCVMLTGVVEYCYEPHAGLQEIFRVFGLQEVLYQCLIKTLLSPQRLAYFRDFPMGFTFQFYKPEQASD